MTRAAVAPLTAQTRRQNVGIVPAIPIYRRSAGCCRRRSRSRRRRFRRTRSRRRGGRCRYNRRRGGRVATPKSTLTPISAVT